VITVLTKLNRIWQSFKTDERGGIARINLSEWSAAFAFAVGLWFLLDWLFPNSDWGPYVWFLLVIVAPLMLWGVSAARAEKRREAEEASRLPPNVRVIPPGEDLEALASSFEAKKRGQHTYTTDTDDIVPLAEIDQLMEEMTPYEKDYFLRSHPILRFALQNSSMALKDIRDRHMESVRKKLRKLGL